VAAARSRTSRPPILGVRCVPSSYRNRAVLHAHVYLSHSNPLLFLRRALQMGTRSFTRPRHEHWCPPRTATHCRLLEQAMAGRDLEEQSLAQQTSLHVVTIAHNLFSLEGTAGEASRFKMPTIVRAVSNMTSPCFFIRHLSACQTCHIIISNIFTRI
jgi:hypothetical protein